jgi:hypothetical protein
MQLEVELGKPVNAALREGWRFFHHSHKSYGDQQLARETWRSKLPAVDAGAAL